MTSITVDAVPSISAQMTLIFTDVFPPNQKFLGNDSI